MNARRETRALLARAFDGRLTLEERFRLEALAREDPGSAALVEEHELLVAALGELPEPALEALDVERSMATIAEAIDARAAARRPRRSRLVPLALAGAATLLVFAGLARLFLVGEPSGTQEPRVDVAGGAGDARPGASDLDPVDREPVAPDSLDGERERASSGALALANGRVRVFPPVDLPATDFDRDRHDRARRTVREHLGRAVTAFDPDSADPAGLLAFAMRFETASADLAAADWPVESIVRGLTDDADAHVARAAMRYIGLRAPRQAVPRLAAALASPDRARAAVQALADAGDEGLDALASALARPELVDAALERASAFDAERAARFAGLALEGSRAAAGPAVANLLTAHGPEGARALIELAGAGRLAEDLALDALARTAGAAGALVRALEVRGVAPESFLLAALERLQPAEALPWIAERCQAGAARGRAVQVLAAYPGRAALDELLRVGDTGRVPFDDFLAAFAAAVDADPERLVELAERAPASPAERARREHVLELCVSSERAAAVPAIVAFVTDADLAGADRERALLAVGEIGSPEHAVLLEALLDELAAGEHRVAAACLAALHALGGAPASERALSAVAGGPRRRLLDALADPPRARRSTVLLYKLARELEPLLDARGRRTASLQP